MPHAHPLLAALETEPTRLHSPGTQALRSWRQPARLAMGAGVLALGLGVVGGPSAWANPALNLNAVAASIAKLPVNGKVSSKPEVQTQGPVQMAAPLRLTAGKSMLLHLPEKAERLSVGHPDVADVVLINPREIYLHAVVGDALHAHRLEGARAHVQRHACRLHAARGQRREHVLVEVQRRGRRRHRPGAGGEHGLVAALVLGAVGVRDVRRQRHVAVRLQQREGVGREAQVEQRAVGPGAAQHLGVEARGGHLGPAEMHHAARARRLARAQVGPDGVRHVGRRGQHALDQRLHRAAAGLAPVQASLDHARVVEHQQVARLQQRGQVAEDAARWRGLGTVEQARGAALGGRVLGDQVFGEFEVEVGRRPDLWRGVIVHGEQALPAWRRRG